MIGPILLLAGVLQSIAPAAPASPPDYPFEVGETLTYSAKLGMLTLSDDDSSLIFQPAKRQWVDHNGEHVPKSRASNWYAVETGTPVTAKVSPGFAFYALRDGAPDDYEMRTLSDLKDFLRARAGTRRGYPAFTVSFDENGLMLADEGVFEVDGTIDEYQPGDEIPSDDMVYVYDLDGAGPETLWRLEIVDETSFSYGNYVDFDQRDISVIALWNHEAGPGEQVIAQYVWNGATYALAT